MTAGWPVSLDLSRDKAYMGNVFRAASIRVLWRDVLDMLSGHLHDAGLYESARKLKSARPASERVVRGLRPSPATLTLLPTSSGERGQLRFVGSEHKPIEWTATTVWPHGTDPTLGQRVYAWRLPESADAFVLLVPHSAGPTLVFSLL